MLIRFHDYFIRHTSGLAEVTVTGDTVGEALEDLFNRFPQLYVFLVARNAEEADKTTITLNGDYLVDPTALCQPVTDADVLVLGRDVPEGGSGAAKIITGAVLVGLAVLAGPVGWGALSAISSYAGAIGVMGASLMVSGAADLLVSKPNLPTFDSGNSNSATYTFSGIQNTTVSGTPIPIVYGRHRIGGHIINAY